MDTETKQRLLARFFNEEIPVHIVTWSDSWINGYIKEFDGMEVTVYDRYDGFVTISILDISKIVEFEGDYATLKRWDL